MSLHSTDSAIRLGDACVKIGSGATPRGGKEVYHAHGVPLIRSQNVYNDGFHYDGLAFIGDDHARLLAGVTVESGDVLLNITGDSVARACIVPSSIVPARVNQHVAIIRPDMERLDARYLRYYLNSPYMQGHMLGLAAAGATRNALTKGMIEDFRIPWRPLIEQRRIAHILGTLDDKIELNRRMNETLEAMARALFKSWFVDFDPVRANAADRQPTGMDAATAALFPASFEESEIGEIPRGWRVGRISDIAEFSRTALNPGDYPNEMFDHYSIPAFDEGRLPKLELGSAIMSNKLVVVPNCVLLSKLNPRIPRVWLPTLASDRRSVCSTEYLVTLPLSQSTRDFVYCLFTSASFQELFGSFVTGTSGSHQRVKPEFLLAMDLVVPPTELVQRFTRAADPLLARVGENIQESRALAATRDALLPKLLSGEFAI